MFKNLFRNFEISSKIASKNFAIFTKNLIHIIDKSFSIYFVDSHMFTGLKKYLRRNNFTKQKSESRHSKNRNFFPKKNEKKIENFFKKKSPFLIKTSIFEQNYTFWLKFRFLTEILDTHQYDLFCNSTKTVKGGVAIRTRDFKSRTKQIPKKWTSPGIFPGLVVFLGVFFRKISKNRKKI